MRRKHLALTCLPCALLVLLAGCGAKEDLGKAKSSVETCLVAWKKGDPPKSLAGQGIEITDPDWSAGNKLLDFTVKNVTSQAQQGPRVVVVLNMQNRAGKKVNTEVAYEVLLKDKIQVGRDAFHVPQ
jgi:hypothetical protein